MELASKFIGPRSVKGRVPTRHDAVRGSRVYPKGSNVILASQNLATLSGPARRHYWQCYLAVSEVVLYPGGTQFREDNLKIAGLTVSLLVYWLILTGGGVSSTRPVYIKPAPPK